MLKLVMPMKRKPGMTVSDFRDYYESTHRLLGEKYLSGFATRYLRRYLDPLPDGKGRLRDPEFDVILEIWYPDEAAYSACARRLSEPDVRREISQDEARLFDTGHMRSYFLSECESDLEP